MCAERDPGVLRRARLRRLFVYLCWVAAAAVAYVLLDFTIDVKPPAVHSAYYFSLPPLRPDEARILRQDNLSIVVIRRSPATLDELEAFADSALQDPDSTRSHQPGYARNRWRSRDAEYFVAYATGTDLGCPLQLESRRLREVCGNAQYDFAGRALAGFGSYANLVVPDYGFSNNFNNLTINP